MTNLWFWLLNGIRGCYGLLQLLFYLSRPLNRLCKRYDRAHNCARRGEASPSAGLLNGQALPPLGELPYGVWRMDSNGCEVIAAYNVLYALGRPLPFASVAAELERRGLLFNGFGGTNLGAVADFLRRQGVPVRVLTRRRRKDFDEAFAHAPCAVLSYWTGPGLRRKDKRWNTLHTVSLHHAERGILVCNAAASLPAPVPAPSVTEFLRRCGGEAVCLMMPEQ